METTKTKNLKSPLPHITDYKDIKKEYSIQLMDDKNTYRTKPITGSADFLLDLLSEDKFDKKKVTVLVMLQFGEFSTLPLYSLGTFLEVLKLQKTEQ